MKIGIVGAGIMGRMVCLLALKRGMKVSLFDQGPSLPEANLPCSLVAAGMLSPYCELEKADFRISQLGIDSLPLWKEISQLMGKELFFQNEGGLVLAHPEDQKEISKLKNIIEKYNLEFSYKELVGDQLNSVGPELRQKFSRALFFENEGQVDPWSFYRCFNKMILPQCEDSFFETPVLKMGNHKITTAQKNFEYDWIIDCRGLEGKKDQSQLRGVRGEIIKIHAPEINLSRPIRLMHPRYCIYIVPRENNHYLIGATNLESEDFSPISVRSALELLSACYSVNSSFSEARIIEMNVQCRPAFPDNNPKIIIHREEGLIRANGLYRHGYLISPKLSDVLLNKIEDSKKGKYEDFVEEIQ
ncbi:FAD-dependent oxidoreductase [Bacteriovoracales bacterium]|nr:FAD-dependent oxidoreductase [Bacteriovoracales bacterium]